MVDVETPPEVRETDRTTRNAALWAAAFAVPIAAATSWAFPTSVWIRMYAWTTI